MLIDNKIDYAATDIKSVYDFILKYTGKGVRKGGLDIVTGFCSLVGLDVLGKELDEDNRYRLVLSRLTDGHDSPFRSIDILHNDSGIASAFAVSFIAHRVIDFLKRDKVEIRFVAETFCHAKAYLYKDEVDDAHDYFIMGSANLTGAGLGMSGASNVELNIAKTGRHDQDNQNLRKWFETLWRNSASKIADPDVKGSKINVKDYFIREIEKLFCREYTPEQIYYKILFELFKGDIDIDGTLLSEGDRRLLENTSIYGTLFKYQQKGVISLIKMLRKWNGAILADAVGLGKTFSALAVMKYFQDSGYTILLICPKKLEMNWRQYLHGQASRFDRDEFRYVIRFHTDLQDGRMDKDDAKLQWIKDRKKLLVVIDESHNLRNDKSSRYQFLMDEIIAPPPHDGNIADVRDVKTLLLSATPINNTLTDVRNQFKMIAGGDDAAFGGEEMAVPSLLAVFAAANKAFTVWSRTEGHTIGGFVQSLPPHFFDLTDRLIVARTRKMIETSLDESLGFPKQLKPINHYIAPSGIGPFSTTADIHDALCALNLAAYQPSQYIEGRRSGGNDWQDNVFREKYLVRMMETLFLKRFESSWISCLKTIENVLAAHENALAKIDAFQTAGTDSDAQTDAEEDEDSESSDITLGKKNPVRLADMGTNISVFRADVEKDISALKTLRDAFRSYGDQISRGERKDEKLEALVNTIREKQTAPNKKVIVFTSYGDTARYLYEELKSALPSVRFACIAGDVVESPLGSGKSLFQRTLQAFSPYSKLYREMDWSSLGLAPDITYDDWRNALLESDNPVKEIILGEIDVLIATDCLSEGQNLQDSDLVVNYDIHWNPVRLIQRFGRIDRIGSRNESVRAVNFWPGECEVYINLAKRVDDRMALMRVGGQETIDTSDRLKKMVEDDPLVARNTKRMLELMETETLADIENGAAGAETLGLQNFTLEAFRQDLVDYLMKNRDLFDEMRPGAYSGFRSVPDLFTNIPESLVAVFGYPRRKEDDSPDKPYERLYLMLQPAADTPPDWKELDKGAILSFLRQNRNADKFVPEWIGKSEKIRIDALTRIVKDWIAVKVPKEQLGGVLSLLANPQKKVVVAEDAVNVDNLDLIVWDYVSR